MTEAIALNMVFKKSDGFIESTLEGETVLMHLDDGKFSSVSAVSRRIWELIDGKASVSAICDQLMEEFEVDRTTCEAQTLAFVTTLVERELLTQ